MCGQLQSDVAPLLEDATPVWVCAENAYYQRDFVWNCAERGWDYSVSVTHAIDNYIRCTVATGFN